MGQIVGCVYESVRIRTTQNICVFKCATWKKITIMNLETKIRKTIENTKCLFFKTHFWIFWVVLLSSQIHISFICCIYKRINCGLLGFFLALILYKRLCVQTKSMHSPRYNFDSEPHQKLTSIVGTFEFGTFGGIPHIAFFWMAYWWNNEIKDEISSIHQWENYYCCFEFKIGNSALTFIN